MKEIELDRQRYASQGRAQDARISSGVPIEDSIKEKLEKAAQTPTTRRGFLRGALGIGGLAALAGGGFLAKNRLGNESEDAPNRGLGINPTPEASPFVDPTQTQEPTPTVEDPTATPTLEPTYTPTVEPTYTPTLEPTATEVPPTPTLENTPIPEWDRKIKLEFGSLSPDLTGFEKLELNPIYINNSFEGYENLNAEDASELLGLYGHMYAEAVANNGKGNRPMLKKSEINALSVDDFKTRLMEDPESCKYKINAHTPENLRAFELPKLLQVDPRKGISFDVLLDSSMLWENNRDVKGNVVTMGNGNEYRYIVNDEQLCIVLIMNNNTENSNQNALYYSSRACAYPLDLLQYPNKMRGEELTPHPKEEWKFLKYYNLIQAPVSDFSTIADGNLVDKDATGVDQYVYPLFKV